MKEFEKKIKKVLQLKEQKIADSSFTKNLVKIHLNNTQKVKPKPFINFLSLIIGLSCFIFSIGTIIIIQQNYDWVIDLGLTMEHGIILSTLSFIFLMHKFIEEFALSDLFYGLLNNE